MPLEKGATYRITNQQSGGCLDLSNSDQTSVSSWQSNGGKNQQWVLRQEANGYWTFVNVQWNKLLAIPSSTPLQGDRLIAAAQADTTEATSTWDIIWGQSAADVYRISFPANDKGWVADLKGGNVNNGTPIILYPLNGANGTPNQYWKFEKIAGPA